MKSWKEVDRLAKVKDKLAKEIEEVASILIAKHNELLACNLEQFRSAPNVDTLLECSPISASKINSDFHAHLLKMSCPWEKRWVEGRADQLPLFTDTIKLGNKWVLKMKNSKEEV